MPFLYSFLHQHLISGVESRESETKPQLKQKLREVLSRLRPENQTRSISDFLANIQASQITATAKPSIPSVIAFSRQELGSYEKFQLSQLFTFLFQLFNNNSENQREAQAARLQKLIQKKVNVINCPSCSELCLFSTILGHLSTCNKSIYDKIISHVSFGGDSKEVGKILKNA